MKVSHEVPLCLLEESRSFNDYDYALLHLILSDTQYRDFYIQSVKDGREVLLDNSLFELGDAMAPEKLQEGVTIVKPEWYVVPDALNDSDLTIERFESWRTTFGRRTPGKTIGVVQGATWMDQVACYSYMSKYADKIALPCIMAAPYLKGFEHCTREEKSMYGRQSFIAYLMATGLWNYNKPHHLLGCTLPQEFSYPLYKDKSFDSLDTSNPIMAGIENTRYANGVLLAKPKTKLDSVLKSTLTDEQLNCIRYNVQWFRSYKKEE